MVYVIRKIVFAVMRNREARPFYQADNAATGS